jgi:hypothetical protein
MENILCSNAGNQMRGRTGGVGQSWRQILVDQKSEHEETCHADLIEIKSPNPDIS